ncbi:hypothetical protein [Streptomyces atriruber]|uniref:hypothetical protein n=1 Tax=Streptomyces atriruber TaxID=545121 RepID=UPI0006E1F8C3|nr:hypothetical protein [Streptomyces atriruber]
MRGQRIPTVPVLAALVRAWGGDEGWWLRFRTATEEELERERLAVNTGLHIGEDLRARKSFASDEESLLRLAQAGDPAPSDMLDVFLSSGIPLPAYVDHEVRELQRRCREAADMANREASAAEWAELYQRAGAPDIRTVAGYAGLSLLEVRAVLAARVDPVEDRETVEKVFAVLQGR